MNDESFESINPATGARVCTLPTGAGGDVDAAVAAARRAFDDGRWSEVSPGARKIALFALADLVDENADELALLDCLEVGKAISNARAEVVMASDMFRYAAEATDKVYGHVAPTAGSVTAFTMLSPRGVIGAIVPWNFPLANAAIKAAPALATGNSIVLKPSEVASLSALRLAELAVDAGVPPGVFNVVPGLGATIGEAIGRHMDIDFLSFTGSTTTGRRLMGYAAESNGKPLMLELGGKSAQIVCDDMADDLEALAARIVHDAFWNQGQWCASRSRLLAEAGIHDRLVDAVADAARKLVPGDPLDPATNFGTLASSDQFERVRRYIDSGMAEGATPILAGACGTPSNAIAPTIFGDVQPDMTIAREEIFGPVLAVSRFAEFAEAIHLANDSPYGLGATVWTRDLRRAQRAAQRLAAGKVLIKAAPRSLASGGTALEGEPWGASGFGAERGLAGLRSYCRLKAIEMSV